MTDEHFEIFLEYYSEDGIFFYLSIESALAFLLCQYIEQTTRVTFRLIKSDGPVQEAIKIDFQSIDFTVEECRKYKSKLPIFITKNIVVSGLCGVLRRILKSKYNSISITLLGFKENCLMAPAEASIWTRFCEVEMLQCTKTILTEKFEKSQEIPEELIKFERDLSNPARIHNVYKIAREIGQNQAIKSGIPVEELNIQHTFSQGLEMTLADFILFCYFKIIFSIVKEDYLKNFLPLTAKWYANLKTDPDHRLENIFDQFCKLNFANLSSNSLNLSMTKFPDEYFSLYKRDLTGFRHKNRIYTEQVELQKVLDKLQDLKLDHTQIENVFNYQDIDDELVLDLLRTGNIPDSRLERKKCQLQSLAIEVIKITKENDLIVDFCSGTGHLGLLLAILLPHCQIIILENKEESINRAQLKVKKMKLENVKFFQCNLEYFWEDFNLGCSLHACGVATDIVLSKCWKKKANFVSCPCCYGKIQAIDGIVQLPQSKIFREVCEVTSKDFLYIAHCSDQTHDKNTKNCNVEKSEQGELCMYLVDSDRSFKSQEWGYQVKLKKLFPENCSLKNHVIVGNVI